MDAELNKIKAAADKLECLVFENSKSFCGTFLTHESSCYEIYEVLWSHTYMAILYKRLDAVVGMEFYCVSIGDFRGWAQQFDCETIWDDCGYTAE